MNQIPWIEGSKLDTTQVITTVRSVAQNKKNNEVGNANDCIGKTYIGLDENGQFKVTYSKNEKLEYAKLTNYVKFTLEYKCYELDDRESLTNNFDRINIRFKTNPPKGNFKSIKSIRKFLQKRKADSIIRESRRIIDREYHHINWIKPLRHSS